MKLAQISVVVGCLFFISCSQNEIVDPPTPPQQEILDFALDRQELRSFKSIEKSRDAVDLDESQIKEQFDTRVKSFIPVKIIIDNDSTVLVKISGLEESYESTWESDKLYIQGTDEGSKILLGEKTEMGFMLTCSFYSNKVTQNARSYHSLGQDYSLEDYTSLIADAEHYKLVWLQVASFYN